MSKEELVILKYINEYKQLSTQQIYDHFHKINKFKSLFFRKRSAEKYSDNSINGCLWYLEVNHDYIRESKDETTITITDKGEIEAYCLQSELSSLSTWRMSFARLRTGTGRGDGLLYPF